MHVDDSSFSFRVRRFVLAVAFSFSVAVESVESSSVPLRSRPAISQADTRVRYGRRREMKDHRGLYIMGLQQAADTMNGFHYP